MGAPQCESVARLALCSPVRADGYAVGTMQFDVPNPAYTGSLQARAHSRLALKIAFGFVALLWVISLTNWGLDLDPEVSSIRPRQWAGLPGIVFAPLVHSASST